MSKSWRSFALVPFFCAGLLGDDELFSDFSGDTSLSLGYGYAENVLFSELAPIDSPYFLASFEGYFERAVFGDLLEWNTIAFLEHRGFQSGEEIPNQTLLLLQTQVEGYLGLYSQWRLGARYLGLEQAFDATFDELERSSFLVKAREPEVLLGWESFLWTFEYDAEVGFSRREFAEAGSDYDSFNWQVDFDQQVAEGITWKSRVYGYDRSYSDRYGRDLNGGRLVESTLRMAQLGLEIGLEFWKSFDSVDHKVRFAVGERKRRDAQLGYYDRTRRSIECLWRADWDSVRLSLEADYGTYRYDHQLGGDGLQEATDTWSWSIELDKKLSERWAVFLWLSGDEEASNSDFSSYEARDVSVGLRWLK